MMSDRRRFTAAVTPQRKPLPPLAERLPQLKNVEGPTVGRP